MKFLTRLWLKKLIRDILRQKLLFSALMILSLFSIGSFIALTMGYTNLNSSVVSIYQKTNFADAEISSHGDVWFNVSQLRIVIDEFMGSHPKILAVDYRLITETGYNLTKPFLNYSRQFLPHGRIIGIETQKNYHINDLIFNKGNYFNTTQPNNSVLVEAHFARYFDLDIDDSLSTTIGNETFNFSIQGSVYSPEYLIIIPSKYDFMPSSRFGVIFIPLNELQTITNLKGLANNLLIKMQPTISKNQRDIIVNDLYNAINTLNDETKNVFLSPIMQENQLSNLAFRLDMQEIQEIALILPIIVLGVGAITIYITLNRLVQSQKRIIGVVSCLGYYPNDVLLHYLCFSLLIGGIGIILGTILGIIVSGLITWVYASVMGFPTIITIQIQFQVVFVAIFTGLGLSLLSGFIPSWKASRMIPREALQTKIIIEKNSRSILEKLLVINPLGLKLVIPIRNLFRKRTRTLGTITILSAAVMILVVAFAFTDSVNSSVLRQFNKTSHYDIIIRYNGIKFAELGIEDDIEYLSSLKGINSIDPVLLLPSIVKSGEKQKEVLIMAWNDSDPYSHNFEWESSHDTLEPNGSMVLCSAVARDLNVQTGDNISFYYPKIPGLIYADMLIKNYLDLIDVYHYEYDRARRIAVGNFSKLLAGSKESISFSPIQQEIRYGASNITISGVTNELWGSVVYTTVETLTSVIGLNAFRNSRFNIDFTPFNQLILEVSQPNNITLLEEIKEATSELDGIKSIDFHYDFQEMVDTSMGFFNVIIGVFLVFASLLAASAIFTTIYVNFQERQTEIATMLTLGLSDNEFLSILTIENLCQTVLGIVFGIPVGLGLASMILDNILRLFYFEINVLPFTWVILWTIVILIVLLSQLPAFYRGIKLELPTIIKELSI